MNLFERVFLVETRQRAPIGKRNIGRMMQGVRDQAVRTYKKGMPESPPAGESSKELGQRAHKRETVAQSRIAKLMAPAQWEAYKTRVARGETVDVRGPDAHWVQNYGSQERADKIVAAQKRSRDDPFEKQVRGRRVFRKHYRRVHGNQPQDIFKAKIQGR